MLSWKPFGAFFVLPMCFEGVMLGLKVHSVTSLFSRSLYSVYKTFLERSALICAMRVGVRDEFFFLLNDTRPWWGLMSLVGL